MYSLKIDLPRDLKQAEIHILSDLHIGDRGCDLAGIQARIDRIKDTPNAYIICNGDLCDNATKTSVSDTYSATMTPMSQIELLVKLLTPVKDRILCMTNGNHEVRTWKTDGIDLSGIVAAQLGIADRYYPNGIVLFVKVGEQNAYRHNAPVVYSFYVLHGNGAGGRKEGGKINRLADLSCIVDTDIYIMGHTHMPAIIKESFFRTDSSNCSVKRIDKMFVNSSSSLDYGGYGEQLAFKPASKDCPVIYISGKTKSFNAYL